MIFCHWGTTDHLFYLYNSINCIINFSCFLGLTKQETHFQLVFPFDSLFPLPKLKNNLLCITAVVLSKGKGDIWQHLETFLGVSHYMLLACKWTETGMLLNQGSYNSQDNFSRQRNICPKISSDKAEKPCIIAKRVPKTISCLLTRHSIKSDKPICWNLQSVFVKLTLSNWSIHANRYKSTGCNCLKPY